MSWEELKKAYTEDIEFQIEELAKISEEDFPSALKEFVEHVQQERKKALNLRKFFKYNQGVIVGIRFPKKSYPDKIKGEPKQTKEGNWYWWGAQYPLMKSEQGNAIGTIFMPGGSDPTKMWEEEDDKNIWIFYGRITRDFKWIDEAKDKYARKEYLFIKEARTRFPNEEFKDMDEFLAIDTCWTELDKIKYTFNADQLLKVL